MLHSTALPPLQCFYIIVFFFIIATLIIFRFREQKLFCDFKNPFKIMAEAEPHLWRGEAIPQYCGTQNPNSENWRKVRDSNPRGFLHPTRFPSVRTRPLCEPS